MWRIEGEAATREDVISTLSLSALFFLSFFLLRFLSFSPPLEHHRILWDHPITLQEQK